jgi:hypothetical protein
MGHGRDNAYVLGHFQEKDPKKKTKKFSFHPLLNGSFEGPMSRVRASPKKKSKEKEVRLPSFIFIALRISMLKS